MTCLTPSLMNKGELAGRGMTTAFPGVREFALSFVAVSRLAPAALYIAAFTPPPPGFSRLYIVISKPHREHNKVLALPTSHSGTCNVIR